MFGDWPTVAMVIRMSQSVEVGSPRPSNRAMGDGAGLPKKYRVCKYIDECPRCSCENCGVGYMDPDETGLILCCNRHAFSINGLAVKRK